MAKDKDGNEIVVEKKPEVKPEEKVDPPEIEKEEIVEPEIEIDEEEVTALKKTVVPVKPEDKPEIDETVLRNAIKKGGQIAKAQLYPEIKRLKEKINKVVDQIGEMTEAGTAADAEAVAKVTEEKNELQDKVTILEEALVETTHKVDELDAKGAAADLETYRQSVLNNPDNKGKVIERLVVGATKEEINNSVEIAKQEHDRITKSVKKDFKIPEKSDEEIAEEKKSNEPIAVDRIDFTREGTETWKRDGKTILADVYAQARKGMGIDN